MEEYDLAVIGGGSAGLKAARIAAGLGRKVAVAEERELGGECFWAGCVPTKAMVRAAQVWQTVRNAGQFGIHAEIQDASFRDAMAYKDRVLKAVSGGGGAEDGGLSSMGGKLFHCRARFESPNDIRMGDEIIRAKRVILAPGTKPLIPPIPGIHEVGYITNREAVRLEHLPRRMLVIGSGPIGLEFAQIFRRFGSEVTVIERGKQVLPKEDKEIAELAQKYLEDEGIRFILGVECAKAERVPGGKRVHIHEHDREDVVDCDEILCACGREAALDDLNLDVACVEHDDGKKVQVDRHLRTNIPHIYAAGDITGGYLFTHVASYQGKLAALNAFTDRPEPFNDRVVPRCTYIDPEVGSIGLTEQEARDKGLDIAIRSFSFADLDRAIIHGEPKGMVKLVIDAIDGQICGAHVIGPAASSILAELTICIKNHLPVAAISDTMHAYPSFPEAVEAAALAAPNFRGQVEGVTS